MPAAQCPGEVSAAVPAIAALTDTTLVNEVTVAATPDAGMLPVCLLATEPPLLAVAPAVLLATEVPLVPPEPCFPDVWLLLPDCPLVAGLLVDVLVASLPGESAFAVEACVAAG
jgi:hypothetical protein